MNDPLAPLRAKFRARAESDLVRLKGLAEDDLASEELRRLAHNIAGAAGTFGYPRLSEAAMAIDDRFAAGRSPDADQVAVLAARLQAVIVSA